MKDEVDAVLRRRRWPRAIQRRVSTGVREGKIGEDTNVFIHSFERITFDRLMPLKHFPHYQSH